MLLHKENNVLDFNAMGLNLCIYMSDLQSIPNLGTMKRWEWSHPILEFNIGVPRPTGYEIGRYNLVIAG